MKKNKLEKCPFCEEFIYWINNIHGKKMPVNQSKIHNGNLIIVGNTVYRVSSDFKFNNPDEPRYLSHIFTCKNKEKW